MQFEIIRNGCIAEAQFCGILTLRPDGHYIKYYEGFGLMQKGRGIFIVPDVAWSGYTQTELKNVRALRE